MREISEFSFAYAFTEQFRMEVDPQWRAAPIFPSLRDEKNLGWDVQFALPGVAVCLQYKASHEVVSARAREVQDGWAQPPFHRFYLWPARHSNQHQLLLELQNTAGYLVSYVAPAFYRTDALNDFYRRREIVQRSVFVLPSEIGPLPDGKDHHVAFIRTGNQRYRRRVYSEPKDIDDDSGGAWPAFRARIERELESHRGVSLLDYLTRMSENLRSLLQRHRIIDRRVEAEILDPGFFGADQAVQTGADPQEDGYLVAAQLAYLAQVMFDTRVMVVQATA